jgi:hypothetical protein
MLRDHGQPITLFGEAAADRRERLREYLAMVGREGGGGEDGGEDEGEIRERGRIGATRGGGRGRRLRRGAARGVAVPPREEGAGREGGKEDEFEGKPR